MARGKLFRTKLQEKLLSGMEKFLANSKPEDVIKITAWLGTAYLIQPIMKHSPKIVEGLKQVSIGTLTDMLHYWSFGLVQTEYPRFEEVENLADLPSWILALTLSALIITFGPAVIKEAGGIAQMGLLLFV